MGNKTIVAVKGRLGEPQALVLVCVNLEINMSSTNALRKAKQDLDWIRENGYEKFALDGAAY